MICQKDPLIQFVLYLLHNLRILSYNIKKNKGVYPINFIYFFRYMTEVFLLLMVDDGLDAITSLTN